MASASYATEAPVEVLLAATALHLARGRPAALRAVRETLVTADKSLVGLSPRELLDAVPPPDAPVGPEILGALREAVLAPRERHDSGAVYTPLHVARRLCRIALDLGDRERRARLTVCDPTVGGGIFLLAAAEALAKQGNDPASIVRCQLWAADLDPVALLATRLSLAVWAGEVLPLEHAACTDTLTAGLDAWVAPPLEGFDLVIGNPPFQSQLGHRTARTAEETQVLRSRLGPAAHRYADTATLFLVASLGMTRPGGHAALIMPQSFLVARDAAPARAGLLEGSELEAFWLATDSVFEAHVRVCAPFLRRRVATGPIGEASGADCQSRPIARFIGRSVEPAPALDRVACGRGDLANASTWGFLTADLLGVPLVELDERSGTLGDLCRATAGFRDQYYGLTQLVTEGSTDDSERRPRLVTSGLVDPGRCLWGRRATKFARRRWAAPVVDLDQLDPESPLSRWGRARLMPKVLVATQTRVLEATVDIVGNLWPSVPVISVEAPAERLFDVAAVLLAPPVSAWALSNFAGAALSGDAIKLAASQVLQIPLPTDRGAWAAARSTVATVCAAQDAKVWRDALVYLGEQMCRAY
ncbi:MAG: SAM-dependent methyltransferase, partial [Acidimicrobiales bacterium]|nr:SAM-dependent methyltransferase [Acidimicrobiales bacterium]